MPGADRASSEAHLAAAVARRYHLAGESKVEIARSLEISRFKVARLLDRAHSLGLVSVQVRDPDEFTDPLGAEIARRYELVECVVVRGVGDSDPTPLVGSTAARVLERVLTPQDVLGLPWSRAVHHAISDLRNLPPVEAVQLCGSIVLEGSDTTPYDVVRRVGQITGGATHCYHAPLIMPTIAGAASVRAHEDIAHARQAADRVTVALCSVGAWRPGASTIYDALSDSARTSAATQGVIGEMMGVLFDASGQPQAEELAQRLVTISHQQLRAVGTVIGMARGADRADATRAALTGGLIQRLVVDEELAECLLA